MEIINKFLSILKQEMTSLQGYGYLIVSSETNNPDDSDLIFHRVVFSNEVKKREVFFDFTPRNQFDIDIFIEDLGKDESFSVPEYLIYKQTKQPIDGVINFSVSKHNSDQDIRNILRSVNDLFMTELVLVIRGEEMLDIPSVDPRDKY